MGEIAVERSLTVAAPAAAIWEELIKVNTWPEWKPFVKKAKASPGPLALGSGIKMTLLIGGPAAVPLSVKISDFEPPKRLAWSGGVPGALSAVHGFVLEEQGGKTKITSREKFSGLLVWAMLLLVSKEDLERLHEQWLQAIKDRMEKSAS